MVTKTEMAQIMDILKTSYPRYYINTTPADVAKAINLWTEMFNDINLAILAIAVKSLISHSEFPPTIADVKKEIYKLNNAKENTSIEAWEEAYKMISNGLYIRKEEFEKASPLVKKFFGSVEQLRDMALIDIETINSVVKGQFLKQYGILEIRNKEQVLMPESIKERLLELTSKIGE